MAEPEFTLDDYEGYEAMLQAEEEAMANEEGYGESFVCGCGGCG